MREVPNEETAKLSWIWLALVVVICDQASKWLVLKTLAFHVPYRVLPVLNWFLDYNQGAAFSFLHSTPKTAYWLLSGIAIALSTGLIIWMYRLPKTNHWLSAALAFILGGALGNLIDRLRFGHVVDFISFHLGGWYFAIFNIADVAITCGAIMLLLEIFWLHKRRGL